MGAVGGADASLVVEAVEDAETERGEAEDLLQSRIQSVTFFNGSGSRREETGSRMKMAVAYIDSRHGW